MRVLVTGGAGYIGSVLTKDLLASNYKVTVLDDFTYSQTSLASCVSNPNLDLVYGDVRNRDLVESLVKENDVIIPLAAIVGAPACDKDPFRASSINLEATKWLFSIIGSSQQIIMPTTNSAYGSGGVGNYCDEESTLNPLSLYARDKVEVEEVLMSHPLATSFRLATVFGISARMRLDLLVNSFVNKALTDRYLILFEGHFKRNSVHVSDVSRLFQFAIANPDKVKGEVFNFGLSEANLSKIELCNEIQKQLPDFVFEEAQVGKDPDQRNYLVSNAKIESIGMKAIVTIAAGISELIKGLPMFRSNSFTNL